MTHPPADALGAEPIGRRFAKLGLGEALARIIAFGATVYLARTLGSAVYGVIVLAAAVLLYLSVLTDCGIDALGVHEVAAAPDALPTTVPEILGARFLVGLALALLTAFAGIVLLPQPDGAVIAAYAFTLPIFALGTRWVQLGLERVASASIARIVGELVVVALVLLMVRRPEHLTRVPLAQLLGDGVATLFLLRLLPPGVRRLTVVLRVATVRTLMNRSWPLILHGLLGLALFNSDMLFLRAFRDSASVGMYAAAYTLISFFLNLGATYTMTLLPIVTRLRDDVSATRTVYHTALAQALAVALPIAAGGVLVAHRLVDFIFGAAYLAASVPLQILLWSIPVAVIRNVAQSVLIAHQRQDQLMRTAAWATAINLVANIALIPWWGLTGAAAATVATEVVRTGLAIGYVHRLGLTLPGWGRAAKVVVATLLMVASVWWVDARSLFPAIGVGVVGYAVGLVIVGALRFRSGALPEFTP